MWLQVSVPEAFAALPKSFSFSIWNGRTFA